MSSASRPDERLGVWRKQRPLACVPSGQWWRVVHSLGQQPALALVYAWLCDLLFNRARISLQLCQGSMSGTLSPC